jgi:hypothetical protein
LGSNPRQPSVAAFNGAPDITEEKMFLLAPLAIAVGAGFTWRWTRKSAWWMGVLASPGPPRAHGQHHRADLLRAGRLEVEVPHG